MFLADCPTRLAVEILSDKWAVLVLHGLTLRPLRHTELVALIGSVSRKVLTETLRRLQQYGLVERRAISSRNVEYSLTDLGRTLERPIDALTTWAREYGPEVTAFAEGGPDADGGPSDGARQPA